MNGIISLDEMDQANETMLEILRNSFDSVTKFNPNHDELGRFATSDGSSTTVQELSDDEFREILYNSKTVNEMFAKVAKRLGKSMKPKVAELSDDEINVYRGVPDVDRDVQRLLDGKVRFSEFQTWGQGIYVASERNMASNYGHVLTLKLDESAKLVRGELAWADVLGVTYPNNNARTRQTATSKFIDMSRIIERVTSKKMSNLSVSDMTNVYWASKGYDGFSTYGEVVLFNGDKLTINKSDIGNAVQKFNPYHDELGRFTSGGVSSAVADSIIARVKANGGLSVKILTGEEPTDGFMVAQQGQNLEVKEEDFFDAKKGKAALSAYLKAKKLVFGKDQYLGLWWNKDKKEISLDVVDKIKTRSQATKAGRERNQQAIWDVKNQEEINTGGTGDRTTEPTLASSKTSKAFGGDDGSGDRGFRVPSLGKFRSGKQRVVQQTIRAKVFKVSFGGDRSEAGRYAANMRWQGHTSTDKPRPVIGFIGKRTHEITADGAIHPKSLTDEIEKEIIDLPRKKIKNSNKPQSPEGAAKSMICANISNQMAVAMVSTQEIKEAYAEIVLGSVSLVDKLNPSGYVSAADKLNPSYGREDYINLFVATWADTSNDGNELSLALQDSAAELFGLKNAVSWDMDEADGGFASEAVDYQPSEKYSPATEKVLTAFLQAQYDATQQYLADKGIKSVTVFRGMRFDSREDFEKAGFDHYTQDDYSNHPDDEKVAQGSAIVRQRPLSSWSVSRKIAVDFAGEDGLGVVIKTRVPSSHIVSTPLTGLGCAQESEVVVMDDPKSLYYRVGGGREVDYIQGPTRRNYEIFGRDLGAWEKKDEPAEFVAL